jgi:hypothetical protein
MVVFKQADLDPTKVVRSGTQLATCAFDTHPSNG